MKHGQYTRLKSSLDAFRRRHPDFALPMMYVFLEICQSGNDGLTITQVEKRTGISQSAASRHCKALTNEGVRGREGFDLCEWHYDLNDRRIRIIKLNANGRQLEQELAEALV